MERTGSATAQGHFEIQMSFILRFLIGWRQSHYLFTFEKCQLNYFIAVFHCIIKQYNLLPFLCFITF